MAFQALFSYLVFGVARIVCLLRGGHRWGQIYEIKNHRERYCVRCDKVDHWIVES